jgi:hypothetical protein
MAHSSTEQTGGYAKLAPTFHWRGMCFSVSVTPRRSYATGYRHSMGRLLAPLPWQMLRQRPARRFAALTPLVLAPDARLEPSELEMPISSFANSFAIAVGTSAHRPLFPFRTRSRV